jgi:alpha-tubulin suppressor-like RCC1 family protein
MGGSEARLGAGWVLVAALAVDAGCGGRSGLAVWGVERSGGGATGGSVSNVTGGRTATGGTGTGGQGGTGSGGAAASGGSMSQGGVGAESGRAGAGADAGRMGMAGTSGSPGGEAGSPPDATLLAIGAFHTCTGFEDGSLRCWGGPGYIGSGTEVMIGDDETPSTIPPVSIGGDVRAIAAGWYHTCAVLPLGNVRCFGIAADGRLGYANPEDIGDDEAPSSAGDVDIGGAVSALSVGPSHTCACLENGAVRCWGENESYRLGYPDLATIGDDETPASAGDIDLGAPARQVVVGGYHSCALLDGGAVRCWGQGSGGRLGYGNSNDIGDDERPRDVGDIDLGGQAVQLTAGLLHTCALLTTGNVRCWGRGQTGALGYGNIDDIGDDETPASAGDVKMWP